MAFNQENMALAGGESNGGFLQVAGNQNVTNNAPRIWTYISNDGNTTVRGSTYFNNSAFAAQAKKGDVVLVVTANGSGRDFTTNPVRAITSAQWMVVMSADGTSVDLSDGTAISVTNT